MITKQVFHSNLDLLLYWNRLILYLRRNPSFTVLGSFGKSLLLSGNDNIGYKTKFSQSKRFLDLGE